MIQWREQVVSRSWWQRKAVVLSKFVLNASGVGLTWGVMPVLSQRDFPTLSGA